jgi:ribosomal protein S27AE
LFLEYVEDSTADKVGKVSDMKALKKWSAMPDDWKETLINNVFCRNCGVTTIVNYAIVDDNNGIVLQGKCAKCGGAVARFVEYMD